jgi:4-amino-4-deoxy-L-arabinose transferase-like glycosyltransferase
MRKVFIEHRLYILTASVLLLALFLRLINLNIVPVFADEAIYIRWAQIMRAESTLRFLPLSDGKQPLFMWSVIPFLKAVSDPLIAGRLVSVFSGAATCLGVVLLTRLLFKSEKVALLAGVLYALSPMMIFFDRMALVDSMLTTFGVWFLFLLVLAISRVRFDYAMMAGFALGGALLTKSTGLFYALLMPFTLLTSKVAFNFKRKNVLLSLQMFFYLLAVIVIAFVMYNILRLGPNYHMLTLRNYDYVYPYSHILTDPFNPFLSHLTATFEYFSLLAPISAVALFILGLRENYKDKNLWLLLIFLLIPVLLVLVYTRVLTTRYIVFAVPHFYIISALAFTVRDNFSKKVVFIFFTIFLIQSAIFSFRLYTKVESLNLPRSERSGYLEEWTSGFGIKESAQLIREYHESNLDRKIVVGTEGYFGTLPDGLQIYLTNHPEITVIGVGIDLIQVPQSLIESREAGNKTYLVINNSRLKIPDYEKAGLSLIAQYPKVNRPAASREYNLHGPQQVLYLFEVVK